MEERKGNLHWTVKVGQAGTATIFAAGSLAGCDQIIGQPDIDKTPTQTPTSLVFEMTETPLPSKTPTLTPEPTTTFTPEPTATATEIPAPELPGNLIKSSYGFLEEESTLQKDEDGHWVLKDVNGRTFYRWDLQESEWTDEKPLYWECGPRREKKGLEQPTGFLEEFDMQGAQIMNARVCLAEIGTDPPNSVSFEDSFFGSMVFYDLEREAHKYNFIMGAPGLDGVPKRVSIKYPLSDGRSRYSFMTLEEYLPKISDFYDKGATKTRQVDLNIVVTLPEIIGRSYHHKDFYNYFSEHQENTLKLAEALQTGRNFPKVPEDFTIYVIQFSTVLDFPRP